MTPGALHDVPGRQPAAPPDAARLEEALRQAEARLAVLSDEHEQLKVQFLQAQKMETVARLASGVAHDFKNVLTLIAGYNDLLLKRLEGSDLREPAVEIQRACQRASGLAQQLLSFSRREAPQQLPVSLNTILADAGTFLRRMVGAHVDLSVVGDPSLGLVMANTAQMHQVLLNLVVNSRDAMPNGGRLLIDVRNVDLVPGSGEELAGAKPGPHVRLSVTDTGVGMDEATRSHAFDPFFTTKAARKGTGLGLSTVHSIVTECHGRVVIESAPGRGTTVLIYLPRLEQAGDGPHGPAAPIPVTRTVLVVDEDEGIRRLLGDLLTHAGFEAVLESGAGPATGLPCDAAIVDLETIRRAGTRAARLLGRCPARKVIGLTGTVGATPATPNPSFELGATIAKPIAPRQLLRAVRDVLEAD
jgi:two-component system, cell cycle sensor histidine kinase and response regulator CckA